MGGQRPYLKAHKGFIEHYNGVKEAIFNHVARMIKDYPATEIYVSGHSLGGAMANIGAVDLAAKYPDLKVALWTFGAPRVWHALGGSASNGGSLSACVDA